MEKQKKSAWIEGAKKIVGEERLTRLLQFRKQFEDAEIKEEVQMAEATLEDGTAIVYDRLETGGMVYVISAEGEQIPAPDGEHVLTDGTKITVSGGSITAVTREEIEAAAEEEEEKKEEEMEVADTDVKHPEEKTAISMEEVEEKIETKMGELYEKIKAMIDGEEEKEEMRKQFAEMQKDMGAMVALVEDLTSDSGESNKGEAAPQKFNYQQHKKTRQQEVQQLFNKYESKKKK